MLTRTERLLLADVPPLFTRGRWWFPVRCVVGSSIQLEIELREDELAEAISPHGWLILRAMPQGPSC